MIVGLVAACTSDKSDTSVFAQANLAHGETEGHAPAWHGASADPAGHRNPAALTGFKTREFGGSGFSQLVFDDSDHQLRIQLHASVGTDRRARGRPRYGLAVAAAHREPEHFADGDVDQPIAWVVDAGAAKGRRTQ